MCPMEGGEPLSLRKTPGWIAREEARIASARVTRRLIGERASSAMYEEVKRFAPPKPSLPEPPPRPTVRDELRRLADGTPQLWTSSIREELVDQGLVEITYREDGRWSGDRITPKGLKALRRGRSA